MDRKEDFPEEIPPPLLDEEEESEVVTEYENPNFYEESELGQEEEESATHIIRFFQDIKNKQFDEFGGANNSSQSMQTTQSYNKTGETEEEEGSQYDSIKDSLMEYASFEKEYSELDGEMDCEFIECPVMEEEECDYTDSTVLDDEFDYNEPSFDDDSTMLRLDVSTSYQSEELNDILDGAPPAYQSSRPEHSRSQKNTQTAEKSESKINVRTSCPENFPIPRLDCDCPQNLYHQYSVPSSHSRDSKLHSQCQQVNFSMPRLDCDCPQNLYNKYNVPSCHSRDSKLHSQPQQAQFQHPHKSHKTPPKKTTPKDLNCDNCCQDKSVDPCFADRPPWNNYGNGDSGNEPGWCHCQSNLIKLRLDQFLQNYRECKVDPCFQPTQIIGDDKGYLFERPKQIRPLWGLPSNQWDIDAMNGKRPYRQLFSGPPKTPLPTFFQPLTSSMAESCKEEDKEFKDRMPFPILHCCDCPCCDCFEDCCPRKWSRGTHRDFRGSRPKGTPFTVEPPTQEDPLIKMLMEQTQVVFNEFLGKKIPIIWIYGRPQKSVAAVRRRYCLSLAETHGFTYISLDEEIAILAAKGSRAIRAGNPFFEGFSAVERLAIPVCIKLVTDPKYSLDRFEAMEMLKFLMLQYFPTNGYIIDGFPWDTIDNEDFERIFYPITCGLYFLDASWTTNKAEPPEVIPPLYFRRSQEYDENEVEEACGNFGLKTLKIIGAEQLLDDEEKIFALHAILDEYLEAYDEVLEGNEDVLRDNNLEFQTFGETVGYGVDLAEYMKRKQEADQEAAANATEPQKHFIELETLKALGWKGDEDLSKFSSTLFDLDNLKVVPSQRMISPEEDDEGKGKHKKRKHRRHRHRGDSDESVVCVDGEPCPEKKRKHHRGHGRKHRCKCRCRCRHDRHKRGRRGTEDYDDVGDNDDNEDFPPRRSTGHSSRSRKPRHGSGDDDDDYGSEMPEDQTSHRTKSKPITKIGGRKAGTKGGKPKESESEMDEDMDPSGPFTTDKRWGYRSTKRLGKHPTVHIPRLSTSHRKTDLTKREDEIDQITREGTAVYALPNLQSHGIPDPYNTLPHKSEQKPGDYLQDFPGPSAPDRFSKINRTETQPENAPSATTAYTPEPTSGLRSLFSDNMSRILAKNQADIRKIKYDKLKQKVGQVEYEIYQDDYRSPKYRFYKKYQDNTPEDLVREKENNVPCANCFDSFKQADQFNKGDKVKNLSHLKHERNEAKEEKAHQYGKGPLFNRIISCLCGEDNEAGFTIPGYKPEPKQEDNTDLDQIDETPDYRKKKE